MRPLLLGLTLTLLACGASRVRVEEPPPDHARVDSAALQGTWTFSTVSFDEAAKAKDAVRLLADGVFQLGTFESGAFVPTPNVGPSGPAFTARWACEPETHTLRLWLDGAEESSTYMLDGSLRFKTESSGAERVIVYYVRR